MMGTFISTAHFCSGLQGFYKVLVMIIARLRSQRAHPIPFLSQHSDQSSIAQGHILDVESPLGAWLHHQCQEKFLGSIHPNNPPGGRNRHLGSKDIPIIRKVSENSEIYHLAQEPQETLP